MQQNQPVVIITGGSDGIGRAMCFEYGRNGYRVVFTGRNIAKIEDTQTALSKAGITHLGMQLDAGSHANNQRLIEETIQQFGRIDVLICNAGISMRVLFEDLDLEIFDDIMRVNFTGVVSLVKLALPHLIHARGIIIGISSINGHRATPARTAYAASKYALQGFFESLRMELMHHQVHVLVACPGFTQSSMRKSAIMKDGNPQGETKLKESKMMSAETVAKKVYRAMISKKRDLLLTTQGKAAVWANKFFPGLMDRIVFRVMARKPDSPFYKAKTK